jgi:hypothetical protein
MIGRFQDYLYAADELAWACYEPAQRKVVPEHVPTEQVKEPPLVFFNGGASPFVSSREQSYEAEAVPPKVARCSPVSTTSAALITAGYYVR